MYTLTKDDTGLFRPMPPDTMPTDSRTKVDAATMTTVANLTMPSNYNSISCVAQVGSFGYFFDYSTNAEVAKGRFKDKTMNIPTVWGG